ncbi:anti-sigma factor [Aquincola sp. S2]|uniref:Anti-sigma factor n=1 Tax=Pseudaquabacterium terrae TaxID=2732868 RepID=A0ABX2ELQ3_9BURK|nr:anti-sigma factor [Aquabacterium terrae]NRF69541.1 anti-sigma factor [Aquabacterium terrae]
MDYGRRELADALAAQYVAGTLRGPARRRFEALLTGHPALRAAVDAWRDRLMPLTAAVEPQAAPASAWLGIERRLWPTAEPAQAAAAAAPWWRSLGFWRTASGFATVAAVGLGVLLASPQPQAPPLVIVLQAADGAPAGTSGPGTFVASVSGDGRSLVTRPVHPVVMDVNRTLELWAVPPQGAPRSLGLISPDGLTVIRRDKLPQALLDRKNTAALAVSVEPPGGSPTGAPTGPVVFAGKLQL